MKHLRNNLSYKALALVLSLGLWANVKLHQEPFTTAMMLPLQVRETPENLVAAPSVGQVTVVLYGPKVYVSRLEPDDLKAYVDLHRATAGHTKQEVAVDLPANLKPLVSIQGITPDTVDVRLYQKRRKSVPVRVEWDGEPLAGARYGDARLDPPTVDVAGAEAVVATVDHARAKVQAGAPHITGRFPVVPVDAAGEPVSEVRVWPDAVTVDVTLTPTSGRQQAFVQPAYTGIPAPGYTIARIWTNPQVVTVLGPSEVVGGINSISTQPVSIAGAKGDVVQTVTVRPPRGATAVPESVQVRIRLAPGPGAKP